MKKTTLIYFVSECKTPGFAYELTFSKNNGERELCNKWSNPDHMRDAIGLGLIKALQSKNDLGYNTKLVIELSVCSIVDPMIIL